MNTCVEVLLIEDNPTDAELTIREFRKHGLSNNVRHLKDGQEALDYLFSGDPTPAPKLILLDIKMPKVNGIEVLQQIKADERTRELPVVMLTSSKENSDIQKCYALGVNSFVVKPVSFSDFTKAIHDLGVYWLSLNQTS